ncbi:Uncharacterized protein FWK35_00019763 [Aphis craccivora]|uniref:Uncharacterized protein n=1 Tax=Aphis craccivora TaxID=307492 RepID=A0A6G0Z811_APHCR|nr:Uncharacterized protein FWK35_00019763 [Aphis craccivora]
MVCIFLFLFFYCVSVYSITSRNNALISNFGGGFRWQNEYSWCIIKVKTFSNSFQKNREIQKKSNGIFIKKTNFRPNKIIKYNFHKNKMHIFRNFIKYTYLGTDNDISMRTVVLPSTSLSKFSSLFVVPITVTVCFVETCPRTEKLFFFLDVEQ